MEVTSDGEVQNNDSDQEVNVKSVNVNSDEQSYVENNEIESPNSSDNANSESEHESDADDQTNENNEAFKNENSDEKENTRRGYEIESCDEDSGVEQKESEEEREAGSIELENQTLQSEGEEEPQETDRQPETPRSPVSEEEEEIQQSDEEVQHSDKEVLHSDKELLHSDDDVQQSDDEVEQQSDLEVQPSDDEEVHHSDNEVQPSEQDVPHSDEEVHRSDEERSPASPVQSEEEQIAASDVENQKFLSDSDDSDSDRDESDTESKVGELIADIFGESDDDEEFEGFGEEDVAAAKQKKEKVRATKALLSDSEEEVEAEQETLEEEENEISEVKLSEEANETPEEPKEQVNNATVLPIISDEESEDDVKGHMRDFISDFDVMLQKKKDSQRRRKRKDVDIINDSDDLIADIIHQMKVASEEDRQLNKNKAAATKKLKYLPMVVSQLRKHDLKEAFLDQGILSVMAEWLSPLPDRSLPHLQIRDKMLRLLFEFPPIDQGLLKSSNIGRAVMYLYKHPKETKENRERAGKLISEWARPIFNLTTNFHSMSKEEREQRDFEHMPKKRKLRLECGDDGSSAKQDIDRALIGEDKALRPGEKGWIARARVPMPSMKDYVVRPKWNVETDFGRSSNRRQVTRLDKHIRSLKEKKRLSKVQRAVTISIEGRKMSL